jgi:hypothetical protein
VKQRILWPVFLAFACWLYGQKPLPPTAAPPPASSVATPGVTYRDITTSAGLGGFIHTSGTALKDYILEAPGSGSAFIDYDRDGWLDIYLVNGSTYDAQRGKTAAPRAALFRNNRDGTFTDVTEKTGVSNSRWGQGVCAGDYDNDGWQDIYVTNYGKNRLYHNNGGNTFRDVAEETGVAVDSWSTGCAFGDYNGDGRLDLFVAGYIKFDLNRLPPAATPPQGQAAAGTASRPAAAAGVGASYNPGSSSCVYRGERVMCGPRGLEGARDFLFRNNGAGTFSDVSDKAGVSDPKGLYGFGAGWFDSDDDGRLDLIVANDSTANYLYRNRGDGTFEDVSYSSGVAVNENGREQAHMGVAIGDYDNDGRDDIHITNFADDSNVLYHNDDGKNYSDVTFAAGVGEISLPFLGWGTDFLDYDNDGWLDLLVANGHVYPGVDRTNWNTSYRQRGLLFRNLKRRFEEIGASAGALITPRAMRGSSTGDFDNDGDVDILLNNLDEPPTLLRNDGANTAGHWLLVRLVGDVAQKCPRDAIGSVVFCKARGVRMRREVASGRSHMSQSDLRLHFGLGAATAVDMLEVRWSNGRTVAYKIPKVNTVVTIDQARGLTVN